jgi:hypothetical protein
MARLSAPNRPCGNCPWRLDVEPGEFSAERYKVLAASAYDRSFVIFQCHKSTDEKPVACAGFLSRGAAHNLAVRLAYSSRGLEPKDRSGGLELHPNFRSLAVANGVEPDDCSLSDCRDD